MIRLVFLRRIDNLSDLWIKSFEGTATGAGKPLFPSKTQTETTKQQTAGGKTSEHSRKQSLQEWYQTTALHRIHWEHIQQSTCRSCRTTWREPRMLIFAALWGLQHQKAWPNTRGVWLLRYIQWHIPDQRLTSRNNLLGTLLRFCKEMVAIVGDIQHMFHCFKVTEEHLRYLIFLWHEDSDVNKDLKEYCIHVHVFGNWPSQAVATYGLRKIAEISKSTHGAEVSEFICRNYYVDDGLTSCPTVEEATSLLQKTQDAMKQNCNLRLQNLPHIVLLWWKHLILKILPKMFTNLIQRTILQYSEVLASTGISQTTTSTLVCQQMINLCPEEVSYQQWTAFMIHMVSWHLLQ